MSPRFSLTELAEIFELSRPTVTNAIKLAGLKAGPDRKFERAEVAKAIKAHVDPHHVAAQAVNGRGRVVTREVDGYATARTEAIQLKNRQVEIAIALKEGALLSRDTVMRNAEHIITRTRSAFLAVGSRLGSQLAGETDPLKITKAIDAEIRAVLTQLADINKLADEALT
jgi:hypothetical protein